MSMKNTRNQYFIDEFKKGRSISEIASETGWSNETVRKVVSSLPGYKNGKLETASDTKENNSLLSDLHNQINLNCKVTTSVKEDKPKSQATENALNNTEELETTEPLDVKWVANNKMVNVVINGKVFTADNSHPNFSKVIDACLNKRFSEISQLIETGRTIEKWSLGYFKFQDGKLYYYGEELNGTLIQKIIDSIKNNDKNVLKYVNFLENALLNDKNSYDEMWEFLKHNDIEIDDEGSIVCYKKVTTYGNGLKDSRTKTIPNDLGTVVQMPRHLVNDDKNQTCSYGLHVGSISYVKDFSGDTIIKVLVRPSDIVSVPVDYNGQKMRCSEYFVSEILDEDLNTLQKTNTVTGVSICNRSGLVEFTSTL